MQVPKKQLKSLSEVTLSADEATLIKWLRSAKWDTQNGPNGLVTCKAKLPEFYGGVRLYKMQGGGTSGAGAMGPLDLLIKKLEFQGVISKQDLYPVSTQGTARFLVLKKSDFDQLRAGGEEDEE